MNVRTEPDDIDPSRLDTLEEGLSEQRQLMSDLILVQRETREEIRDLRAKVTNGLSSKVAYIESEEFALRQGQIIAGHIWAQMGKAAVKSLAGALSSGALLTAIIVGSLKLAGVL